MRFDAVGIFWQDAVVDRRKGATARVMPELYETGWQRPKSFPSLRNASSIAVDLETYDPELEKYGAGWARGRGHIIGAAIGTEDASWYFPFRHEVCTEQNFPEDEVLDWLRQELCRPSQPKIGANLLYDYGWLKHEGVQLAGELHDVQFAEALLSESALVNLDELAEKYLGVGKDTERLYAWLSAFYGGPTTAKQKNNFYRCPASLIGPYAVGDVVLPYAILRQQWQQLERLNLLELYRMECDLIPLLVEMRFAGVPVDRERAAQTVPLLLKRERELVAQVKHLTGVNVNVNASASIAQVLKKIGVEFPTTSKGAPSIRKKFLESIKHPAAQLITEAKKLGKTRGTFIEGYVLKANVDGIVYPQFHPLRGDEGGTRSGRFASSKPNYQNLPSRDEEMTPLVRGVVVPDFRLGHDEWMRKDYSQIEYRFLAHYAVGEGSDALRNIFCTDPKADYHESVRQLIYATAKLLLERKPTKTINFGLIYGMGIKHLAESLGMTISAAKKLFATYHKGAPYVKATMEAAMAEASDNGVITTILGRRSTFDLWVPEDFDENAEGLPYDIAVSRYGCVRRAYVHKALNRRLQGSAADLMKLAMLICWREGVFNVTGVPRLTVHDELDFSRHKGANQDAFDYVDHVMTTCLKLRVPISLETSVGPDWGACK